VPAAFCGVYAHKPSHGLLPQRGHTWPGVPAIQRHVDLAVSGPMARSAADLSLAVELLAGPDEAEAVAYRLALPPPRADQLKDFRVLVIDSHPLLPTSMAVREALGRVAQGLDKAGATVARQSPLLPDLANLARTYFTLLMSVFGADFPVERYNAIRAAVAGIPPGIDNLDAVSGMGIVVSHRDWIKADRVRSGIAAQWRALFREFDVVLCPVMPTAAFPHDHSPDQRARRIDVDGVSVRYTDQGVWAGVATLTGLPATAAPVGRSTEGLPIGIQIIGPLLEDRTALRFAELVEREFGGFVPPPGFS
jgi:amidase